MATQAALPTSVQHVSQTSPKPLLIVPSPKRDTLTPTNLPHSRLFEDALLGNARLARPSRPAELLVAFLIHVALIAGPILAGLYYTDSLDLRAFTSTLLVAPPPPPPPPAAPASAVLKSRAPKRVFVQGGKLLAPTYIPKQVAQLKEAPLDSDPLDGLAGGVPGGVPGGQLGGVIGGIVGSASQTRVPVPTAPSVVSKTPLRVGGRIKPPRLIYQTTPGYPPIAKQTHIQGVVQIDAVIDTEGNVVEMRAVSGHPTLIQAALSAVATWKYEPTYLNDQAIPVRLIVNVTFQLN